MAGFTSLFPLVALCCLSGIQASSYCVDDNLDSYYCDDDAYCCGDNECCMDTYSVWGLWYFWLIAVFVICLISSCIGCCVRASRRRRAEQYMRINHTIPAGYGTTRVTVTPVAYPNGMANPPQYGNAGKVEHAAPPAYHAPPQYAQ